MDIKPLITEKTLKETAYNRYTFLVNPLLDKRQIRQLIGSLFKVNIIKIETIKVPARPRRFGRALKTFTSTATKKAVVQLKKGQKIDLFETPTEAKTEEPKK